MTVNFETRLARFITAALFVAVLAGTWDVWWHGAVGRDTLFEPPHLLLYAAVFAAIVGGVYGFRRTRDKNWRRLAILLLLIPFSAPFDELWHRIFGVEDLRSALVVWSPPHVLLVGALIGSFWAALLLLKKEADTVVRFFFSSLAFGGVLSLLLFLTIPVYPFEPYQILGFWGAGVVAAVFVGMLLVAEWWLKNPLSAVLVTVIFLPLESIGVVNRFAPGILIEPHPHPEPWIVLFATLLPAVWLALSRWFPAAFRGGVAGGLYGLLLYGLGPPFFEPQFSTWASDAEILLAILSCLFLGFVAGAALPRFSRLLSRSPSN